MRKKAADSYNNLTNGTTELIPAIYRRGSGPDLNFKSERLEQ